jgi:hypothetical protein
MPTGSRLQIDLLGGGGNGGGGSGGGGDGGTIFPKTGSKVKLIFNRVRSKACLHKTEFSNL